MFEYKVMKLLNDLVEYSYNKEKFYIEDDEIRMYIDKEEIPHIKEEYGEIYIEFNDKKELEDKILEIRSIIREKKKKMEKIKKEIERIKE